MKKLLIILALLALVGCASFPKKYAAKNCIKVPVDNMSICEDAILIE